MASLPTSMNPGGPSARFRSAAARAAVGIVGVVLLSAWLAAPGQAAQGALRLTAGPAGGGVIAMDVAADAGIFEVTETFGALVHDINVDGWPDILLGRHGGLTARLYLNDQNGHFTEVAPGTFVLADRHHCDAADVDGNGLPDIACARGSNDGNGVKANELWIQGPGNSFVNRAGEWTVLDPYARGKRTLFLDANGDTQPDLFIGNDPSRADGLPSRNRLFINSGTAFRYTPEMGVDRDEGARCVDTTDFDADGWEDLVVCAEETGTRLYRNEDGTGFVDVSADMRIPESDDVKDATLADLDGDGSVDLVQVLSRKFEVFVQGPGAFQSVFTKDLEDGIAVAVGDANGDGSSDLYVAQKGVGNKPDFMLINDGTGRDYTEMAIPQAAGGEGNEVAAMDYDGNGFTDFLVLNGHQHPGPVQLIAFFPALGDPDLPHLRRSGSLLGGAGPVVPTEPFGNLKTLTERWDGGAWSVVPSPNPSNDNNTLRSAALLSTGDVWSVGYWVAGAGGNTLAERWNGQQWSVVATPNAGSTNYLFSVAALSPSNVWAVGSARVGGAQQTLTERWDGSSWTIVPSPSAGVESDYLHAVDAVGADDVWAVGRSLQDGSYRTLVEHWDGSSWTIVPSPNVGDGHNALLGVWAKSQRSVWAVGYSHDGTAYRTIVQRWNGRSWKVVPSPNMGQKDNLLLGVSGSSQRDIWAVGYRVKGGALRTLVEHWDGRDWTVVSSPNPGQGAAVLRSVAVAGPADAWAVGTSFDPVSGFLHTVTTHWDGSVWTVVQSPNVADEDNELIDVTIFPDQSEIWAVGNSYNPIKERD